MRAAASVTRVLARVARHPERSRTLVNATSSSTEPAPAIRSRLICAFSGFQKNLAFGVSNVNANVKGFFGHDASFVAKHPRLHAVGVADGVGGWETYGIDPSGFSQQLMTTCKELVEKGRFEPAGPAADVLSSSYKSVVDEDQAMGSSTACVVALECSSSELFTANLGDSGFLVYRPSEAKVVAKSEEQTHTFNTPYQLACIPVRHRNSVGGFLSDKPQQAQLSSVFVKPGDLILVATDGLFDNMPMDLICTELAQLPVDSPSKADVQAVANSIALQARRLSIDEGFFSPFAEKLLAMGLADEAGARGGKVDDITVVLSLVSKE